jgi:hypothetical protein
MPLVRLPDDLLTAIGQGLASHVQLIADVRRLRRGLTAYRWSSLCDIYPRRVVLGYYQLLLQWARLCHSRRELLRNPVPALAAEVFMRYVCEIDSQLDKPKGIAVPQSAPRALLSGPRTRELAAELVASLRRSACSKSSLRMAASSIREYRRSAKEAVLQPTAPERWTTALEAVLAEKERTSANLFATWSDMLCSLYEIPAERKALAACFFRCYGMQLQVLDDFVDVVEDDQNGQANIILAAIRTSGEDSAGLLRNARGGCSRWFYDGGAVRATGLGLAITHTT